MELALIGKMLFQVHPLQADFTVLVLGWLCLRRGRSFR